MQRQHGTMNRPATGRRRIVVPSAVCVRPRPLVGVTLVLAAVALLVVLPAVAAVPMALVLLVVTATVGHRTLADLVAGLTLMLARPYATGELVRLSVAGSAPVDAEVLQVRLLRTALCAGDGMIVVRNSDMLRTAA